jgi:hypothetical protein
LAKSSRPKSVTKYCHSLAVRLERNSSPKYSNSHYEDYFGISSAEGTGNTKMVFWKVRQRRTFQKTIFIMRIADQNTRNSSFS